MTKPIDGLIADYVKSYSRNKIIFHSQDVFELESVNVGLRISESIYNLRESRRVAMRVSSELDKVLSANIFHHKIFGRYLSIENLGFLFEPELRIDFFRFLDNYSQNNLLFVKWEGEIDAENIYFLTEENGIQIDIKNLSHITI